MECLNCKTDVPQTAGKRAKIYCSEKCRVEYFRKKKPKGKPGRPRKEVLEVKPIIQGPMKEVLAVASEESEQLAIQSAIALIKAEKIPLNQDTPLGRKAWNFDQQKRISDLKSKLK